MCFRVKSPFRMAVDAGYLGTKGTGLATGRRQWTAVARAWLRLSAPLGTESAGCRAASGRDRASGSLSGTSARLSIGMFAVVLTT